MRPFLFILLLASVSPILCNLLNPGINEETVTLANKAFNYFGFAQSALNGTEVQLQLTCQDTEDFTVEVQFVLRSSPCDKEFFDSRSSAARSNLLQFYFQNDEHYPTGYDYDKMVWYKSEVKTFNCRDHQFHFQDSSSRAMEVKNVSAKDPFARKKRAAPSLNRGTLDGGAKNTLTSWQPAQTLPIDGIYFLVLQVTVTKNPDDKARNLTIAVEWRQPHGLLSAIDYPLLRFYIIMCVFYGVVALVWLYLCIKYYKDILRIQYWIGGVIIIGMLEKAFFLSEYSTMNSTGSSTEGVLELAELVSCAKRTMARVLVIIVSVGYGVVKPRLGNVLNQVAGVGLVYFVFCAIESLSRVSKNQIEAQKQKQFAALPLVITDMIIFYWIYTSLGATMTTLRIRRNEVKLSVYRHFTNTLLFAALASVCFMTWSIMYHVFPACLKEWKGLWVDTAFWHLLFCSILVVIMFLWRPSNNNQRYAFTPLLDDSEDENDQDELFNSSFTGYEQVALRDNGQGAETRKQKEKEREDRKLQEDLRWIEDHIPASLTDHLIIDEEEEKEARELEISKML